MSLWPDSIRWRLTAWYAAVMLVTLLTFGAGVERYFTRAMEANRDAALRNVLDVLAGSLQHEVLEHGGVAEGERSFAEVAGIHARTFRQYGWRLRRESLIIGESGEPGSGPWPARAGEYSFSGVANQSRRGATVFRLAGKEAQYQVAAVDLQPEWAAAIASSARSARSLPAVITAARRTSGTVAASSTPAVAEAVEILVMRRGRPRPRAHCACCAAACAGTP